MEKNKAVIGFRPTLNKEMTSENFITSNTYIPGTWFNYQHTRKAFNDPNYFDKYLEKQLTITPIETFVTHNTMGKIWSKFSSCFAVVTGMLVYEPIFEEYIKRLVLRSVEDGVGYIEIRFLMILELSFLFIR